VAVLLLVNFLLIWGYYVAFEMLWNGQTPGKRVCNLRVMRENGYALGFLDSLIRNLVRIIDFLPLYYGVGVVTMLIDNRSRRLGDLAAGTIVVKERGDLRAADLLPPPLAVPTPSTLAAPADVPVLATTVRLSEAAQAVLREYLRRRDQLAPGPRAALGQEVATTMATLLEVEPPTDVEGFLERVAAVQLAPPAMPRPTEESDPAP
jgi:hypothetical protein